MVSSRSDWIQHLSRLPDRDNRSEPPEHACSELLEPVAPAGAQDLHHRVTRRAARQNRHTVVAKGSEIEDRRSSVSGHQLGGLERGVLAGAPVRNGTEGEQGNPAYEPDREEVAPKVLPRRLAVHRRAHEKNEKPEACQCERTGAKHEHARPSPPGEQPAVRNPFL